MGKIKLKNNEKPFKINSKKLYKLYMGWVNQVSEDCDWKTHFGPEEIVGAISRILEDNPEIIEENPKERVF